MNEKNFLDKFQDGASSLTMVLMLEIVTAIIVLLTNHPTSIGDYLFLMLQFFIIGGGLVFLEVVLTTVITTLVKKCDGKISENVFNRIILLLPLIVMMIYALLRMMNNGKS